MKKAMRNSAAAIAYSVLLIVGGFVLHTVMADALGQANLGLNSVFTNIVSLLSLTELGIASAITYNLYAPLHQGDEAAVAALMGFFAKAYRVIAAAVTAIGLALLPFVHLFVRDSGFPLAYIRWVYLLFILKTAVSYLLSYRRTLMIAAEQSYIVSLIDLVSHALSIGLGVLVLLLTRSFVYYLLCTTIVAVLGNAAIMLASGRLYPKVFSRPRPPLDPALRKDVLRNVSNIFVMRLSGVILNSTDSIIISSFVGVVSAGIYDSYARVVSAPMAIVTAVSSAIQPTFGRLYAGGDKKELRSTLSGCTFAFYLLCSFAGVCLFCLLSPFVTGIWLGRGYYMSSWVIAAVSLNFFLIGVRTPLWSMLAVSGLFARDKYISITGAVLNLGISLALVGPLGILGVLIGTLVSQLAQLVLKTRLLHRRGLEAPCTGYVQELLQYFPLFAGEAALTCWLCSLLPEAGAVAGFILRALLCAVVPNAVNLLVFFRSRRFSYIKGALRELRKKPAKA